MSDLDLTNRTNFAENQGTWAQDMSDQALADGAEMKARADQGLRAATEVGRDKFKGAAEAVKDVASETADHLQDKAREQQRSGADFIERFAGNIREAAHAFDADAPFAARSINSAADYVTDAAQTIRDGSFRDLVNQVTDFAKRQPAAFMGLSVLVGFAAIRFLKASEHPQDESTPGDFNVGIGTGSTNRDSSAGRTAESRSS